jgi:nucleoside-diphosphate-sugar epimerase
MKVLVTGGTGFVGATAVAALADAGHDVRLLARDPGKVAPALRQHGPALPDLVRVAAGDATDPRAVVPAVEGCDAVVHAAAVYSLDRARRADIERINERAAEVVLRAGVAASCRAVVHVSSTVALLRRDGDTDGLPLGDVTPGPYTASKVASERIARELQDAGAPVVCLYPGRVYGPRDHYLGESAEQLRWIARGLFPLWPEGGLHCVDVRDVAACIVAVLQPGRAPGRYVVPGSHVDAGMLFAAVQKALHRRRPHAVLPRWLVGPLTTVVEASVRPLPERWRYPAEREGADIVGYDNRFDDSSAREDLGVHPRDWEAVVADTVDWLVEAGHLPGRYRQASSSGMPEPVPGG